MTTTLANNASWQPYRDRILLWLNTALVCWFFMALTTFSLNPTTTGLLLLALLTVWPSLKKMTDVPKSQALWLLALILYGLFSVAYILLENNIELGSLDRPARFVAMALVMLYLLRFGFFSQYIWFAIMLGTLTGASVALYQAYVLDVARTAVGSHPITFGYLMAGMSMLCFFYAVYEKNRYIVICMAASGLLGVLGAFSTGTRGVLVIYAVVLCCLAIIWLVRTRLIWRWLGAGFVALSLILIASYQLIPQAKRAINQTHWELKQIQSGNLNTSFGTRLQMWSVAFYHGMQNPVTGVGHDLVEMRKLSQPYIESKGISNHALQFNHFHNMYLEAFAKRGIPGVTVLLFLMFAAVWGMKTYYRNAVFIILSIFLVGGLTEAVMNSGRLLYLLMLGVSLFRCLDYFESKKQSHEEKVTLGQKKYA